MAIIPQMKIFNWKMVETSSDLQRLELVLSSIPDEHLIRALEAERKGRRDDYPIRPTWNTVIAGIVFGDESIESLRRELLRNGEHEMYAVSNRRKARSRCPNRVFIPIFYGSFFVTRIS